MAAWALRALVERGCKGACSAATAPVLERARRIPHPVSRMDALELLVHAVFDVAPTRKLVLVELLDACRAAPSWKAPRCLARTAVALAGASHEEAELALAPLAEGPHERRALREIAAGGCVPRRFFG